MSDPGLADVSCVGPTDCVAVGTLGPTARWNGSTWTPLARIGVESRAGFDLISCTGPGLCVTGGVSDGPNNLFVLQRDKWQDYAVEGLVEVDAVSCASARFCMALNGRSRLATTWNGTKWASPAVDVPGESDLSSVSCPTASFCLATNGSGGGYAIFSGRSWQYTPAPLGEVNAVSCATPDYCVTGGLSGASSMWNGTSWSHIAAPRVNFASVSCPELGVCLAATEGGDVETLTSAGWTTMANLDPDNGLVAIDCPTTRTCLAISGTDQSFVYRG